MHSMVVCSQCEKINRVPLERATKAIPVCGSCKSELPFHDGVQELSGGGLTKLIRSADRPLVVDFWAEWCGPCKAFAPTFRAAAQELGGKILFAKLDTERYALAAQTYQIRGIPTLIVFKDGFEVDRQSGAMPLPMFLKYLSPWSS
jgi:thioredoxin 2